MDDRLPDEVYSLVADWLDYDFVVTHFWKIDGTYFVTCYADTWLYFLRCFEIGGRGGLMPRQWAISQDSTFEIVPAPAAQEEGEG